jgi:hypothetical protein
MKSSLRCIIYALGLIGPGAILQVGVAHAESPYERDQREQMEHYQQQHGFSPQVQQAQRWEQEWRQEHPGEPMPSFGLLEKMHRGEIIATMNRDFDRGRQLRQAELRRNYMWARQRQQRILDSRHQHWSPQQWRAWDQQYAADQQAQVRAMEDGKRTLREIDERKRWLGLDD